MRNPGGSITGVAPAAVSGVAMRGPEDRPQPPAVGVDGAEDPVVGEREDDAEAEVQEVSERLRVLPVLRQRGPEEEREVDARQPKLARGAQRRREDERAGDAADDGPPDHAPSASAI